MKNVLYRSGILGLLYFIQLAYSPVPAFAATPTITSVSGTVQTGQTLTITGTSMVQEDRTNWDPLFVKNQNASGYEGASLTADGYQTSGCPSYTSSVKLMGTQSLNMHLSGEHIRRPDGSGMAGCASQWIVQASLPGTTWTDVYFRVYSRWNNTSWATDDTKFWWLAAANSPINGQRWGFPSASQFWVQVVPDGSNHLGNIPGGSIQNNKWYLIEGYTRVTNPPGSRGSYPIKVWFDNQLIIDGTDVYGATPNNAYWGWESNTNLYNTPAGWVSDHWQDGFAVSKTRIGPASLIEIGNNSNYTTATKVYQSPEFLSDTSSQIKINLTGLDAGPYFLWVTNNRGERSLPYSLTTTSSTAPIAPNSLVVH